jgi:hypothetical protein
MRTKNAKNWPIGPGPPGSFLHIVGYQIGQFRDLCVPASFYALILAKGSCGMSGVQLSENGIDHVNERIQMAMGGTLNHRLGWRTFLRLGRW